MGVEGNQSWRGGGVVSQDFRSLLEASYQPTNGGRKPSLPSSNLDAVFTFIVNAKPLFV